MLMNKKIRILSSKDVDREKWDKCARENENGLIYARSLFLDYMAGRWKGIVVGEYESVMPICYSKKYGVKYLVKPAFAQQLGLIGYWENSESLLRVINKEYRYGDVYFNFGNQQFKPVCTERTNFILSLKESYRNIYEGYKLNLKRSIAHAERNHLQVMECSVSEAIGAYKAYLKTKTFLLASAFDKLEALCKDTFFLKNNFARKVVSLSGETLAVALFLKDNKRIYNIAPTTFDNGRKTNAMHFLLNEVIKEFACTDLLFDFEGSEIPGVRTFYLKFSPVNQPYYHYHFNKLPVPLRFFKK